MARVGVENRLNKKKRKHEVKHHKTVEEEEETLLPEIEAEENENNNNKKKKKKKYKKGLFKKYLNYEKAFGDEERVEYIKRKAMEYIDSLN